MIKTSVFMFFKGIIPHVVREGLRQIWRHRKRLWPWLRMILGRCAELPDIAVFYGHPVVPGPRDHAYGGMIKFQRMQQDFPNSPYRFNLLYLASSWRPKDWRELLWLARHKNAAIVWNQNGVGYPAWCGEKYEHMNAPMRAILHEADYVLYQSHFCKLSADHFLGERHAPSEILYNPVDTTRFVPSNIDPNPHHIVLLLAGTQNMYYRVATAIRTLEILVKHDPRIRLMIAGKFAWASDHLAAMQQLSTLISDSGVSEHVEIVGPYTQQQAPALFQQAHILLHTQYNDACPGLVLEAMASGLPIVYSNSGGTPELVGESAGIGVPAELSWDQVFPPDPEHLALAVQQVLQHRQAFAQAARQRVVELFDVRQWLQRHHDIFEKLLATKRDFA